MRLYTVLGMLLIYLPVLSQNSIIEKLDKVEQSKTISQPKEIWTALLPLKDKDSVVLITFSKSSGAMLFHGQTTKKEVLGDLNATGFKHRYFVLLIDRKAILFLND